MLILSDLRTTLFQTLKHSLVLGVGWMVATVIRLSLLPVFTRYLNTTEYGTVAFLDTAVGLARILLVAGLSSSILRFFNEKGNPDYQKTVVSTGMQVLLLMSIAAAALSVLTAEPMGSLLLGSPGKSALVLLAAGEMIAGLPRLAAESFLTATRKTITLSVIIACQALCSAAVNLYLVVYAGLGVRGMLLGNFLVALLFSAALTGWTLKKVGWRFDRTLLAEMMRFGLPMIPALLAAAAMHQADRLFIRSFASIEEVGIYSIAYTFPFMLSSILIQNFERIWGASLMYEAARAPDAGYQLRRMCTYTMFIIGIALFGTAMGARSIVSVFTGPSFHEAYRYMPPIALGVWIYALHIFVRTGVVLKKKTHLFPVNYGIACGINIALNFILVPYYGGMGAAWASVITYSWFSIGGYFLYRHCYRLEIEWGRLTRFMVVCVAAVIFRGMVTTAGFSATLATDLGFFLVVPLLLFLWPGFVTSGEKSAILELTLRALPGFVRSGNIRGNA